MEMTWVKDSMEMIKIEGSLEMTWVGGILEEQVKRVLMNYVSTFGVTLELEKVNTL